MANSEKEIDCRLTMAFRNKLVCKKCDIFPRPDTEVMRCVLCKSILCGKCCGTKCPLCQHESKNPEISTFIKEPELMEVLSGLKTHPCINVKNGCLEEISAKLDGWSAHDQSCIFQKVLCPDCEEVVIFKDLGQHLKQVHVNESISIYYDTETNEYTYVPGIFGTYNLQAELINGRKYYRKGTANRYAISWDGKTDWYISYDEKKGKHKSHGYAYLAKDVQSLHNTTDWKLYSNFGWSDAGKMLRVKGKYYYYR